MSKWVRDNGLSLALFTLFTFSIVGHAIAGWDGLTEGLAREGVGRPGLESYLTSEEFGSSLLENGESEFLSTAILIVLAVYLREKVSPESKPVSAPHEQTGNN